MTSASNSWWIGPLVLMALRLLYLEAQLARTAIKGRNLIFRGGLGLRLLLAGCIVGVSVLISTSIGSDESWISIGLGCFVVAWCFAWPVTLVIGDDGLRRSVWWRRASVIPWKEVTGIERNIGGEIQVFGKDGKCITFTRFHVDPSRFQDEVMRRAGLREVLHASDLPSLRK